MKSRLYVFLAHLAVSIGIATVGVMVVFFVWYPIPLNDAVGVTQIFLILTAVDIVLGPVVTLITYKPTKNFFRFDLPMIAALQIIALSYGMFTVFEGRPVFIVFNRDRFYITRVVDIDKSSAQTARLAHNTVAEVSWFKPKWVAAMPAIKSDAEIKRFNEVFLSAKDWQQLPESFAPLQQAKEELLKKAKPLQKLEAMYGQEIQEQWKDLPVNQVKWLPLRGVAKDMVILIDTQSTAVLKVIDVDPWSKN